MELEGIIGLSKAMQHRGIQCRVIGAALRLLVANARYLHSGNDGVVIRGADANDRGTSGTAALPDDRGQSGQRTGIGLGDALDENFDPPTTAERGAGIHDRAGVFFPGIFVIGFISDNLRFLRFGNEKASPAGDIAFQAPAADSSPCPPIAGDEHPRPRPAIGRALD